MPHPVAALLPRSRRGMKIKTAFIDAKVPKL
jgi:hypothetical protein